VIVNLGVIVNLILALSSAGLLVLVFPPFGFVWLAPIALAPLLVACAREDRWKWRFALGYIAGVAYWFGVCHWIQWTLEHHAAMGGALAWVLFAMFCLVKALQLGVFAVAAGAVIRKWYAAPAIAALWTALEWTHRFSGFEWLNLGNAASDIALPLRLAPVTGVWGISFLLALTAAVIASAVVAMTMNTGQRPAVWLFAVPGLLLFPHLPAERHGTATAVVVQPNIDDESVWTDELLTSTERQMRLFSLTAAGRNGAAAVIVWPEVPAPFYETDAPFRELVSSIAKEAHASVLTGVVARTASGEPLNSALLVDDNGNRVSRYDKVNLVPFGEFVPWPFGLVTQKVSTEAGDFASGSQVVVSSLGAHKIGTFICYESVFPNYIRQFTAAGAQVLFNISNDSWFGKTAARYQHLLLVRMRAAENDRWIVRSTNDGISGVIDPAGRVGLTLPEFQEAAARVEFNYIGDETFYARHGDWFVLVCWVGAIGAVASAVLPQRRRS
jgi:apolipoprotein N-acyltransferase